MVAAAVALSFILLRLDAESTHIQEADLLYSFGPEGARSILSAIAGSMITIAGLTFSLTMLSLQLASSQFGPRLLRNIMQDRGNQVVLGIFIATFVYCLLVLRTVRGIEGNSFVPHLSVACGILLALVSLALLIYFIHHVASAIRVENLLQQLTDEAIAAIDAGYPDRSSEVHPTVTRSPSFASFEFTTQEGVGVPSPETGYVQRVDLGTLISVAKKNCFVAVLKARPGAFIVQGESLLGLYCTEHLSNDVKRRFQEAFVTGTERTPYEDVDFCLRRIVEVAQRALSHGINDPTTAIYCIDRLRQAFLHLAERSAPPANYYDEDGHVRLILSADSLPDLASRAFAAIVRYASADPDVITHLLRAVDAVSSKVGVEAQASLEALTQNVLRDLDAQLSVADRSLLQQKHSEKVKSLG